MIHVQPPFDADQHRYMRPDVRPYSDSVTGRLKAFDLYEDAGWYTTEGRERGRLIHLLTEWDDLNDLVEESVDPALAGYLAAWRRFKAENEFEVAVVNGEPCIERRYGDDEADVAGMVDRIGHLRLRGARRFAVVDAKRGKAPAVYGVQLAAYADFVRRSGEFPGEAVIERVGVHLTDHGTYQLHIYTDRNDFKVWAAANAITAWRRAHCARQREAA